MGEGRSTVIAGLQRNRMHAETVETHTPYFAVCDRLAVSATPIPTVETVGWHAILVERRAKSAASANYSDFEDSSDFCGSAGSFGFCWGSGSGGAGAVRVGLLES